MEASATNVKFFLLCLLCLIMFNSFICSLKVHCNEKDMNTLLHFKQGVIDPSSLLSSWFPELDWCQWIGVKCDNTTSRITKLNLACHTNHSKVVALLDFLNLSNNDFKSIHYNSMGSQKFHDLSRGNLPHLCGNSTNLHYLDLSYNYDLLAENLHWISRLSSLLQYLDLGDVHLHKETDWLQSVTMLPSLLELHLVSCQLENIYPFLQYANYTSLQVLNLADNDLYLSCLVGYSILVSCDISHTNLSQNHMHSQLPKTLSNLEQLQELDLSKKKFSGPIPATLGNLSSLVKLILKSNDLNGNLPDNKFKFFSKLRHFSMSSPALIFDFDPKWVPPFQLLDIYLGFVRNKLPVWLFTQSSLKVLRIVDSTASFEPLDKLWNFATQLEYFYLLNNMGTYQMCC
ncbi:hypothetical protein AAZX31_15G160800 [Glycine max]